MGLQTGWAPPSLPFVLHTSLHLSITRALYAKHSEDKVTHLSRVTPNKSLLPDLRSAQPAYQTAGRPAPGPQHTHCSHLTPEMTIALRLEELLARGTYWEPGNEPSPEA